MKSWSKPSYDVHKEKLSDARDLGAVRLNNSRLNAFASLEVGDEVDHFSFWIQSKGKTRLGMTDDPYLRVELLDRQGKVLADSDANNSDALFNKYLEFNEFGLDLKKDKYYIRVSRNPDFPKDERKNYSIQLAMGENFRNDYDTFEKPAQGKFDPMQAALNAAGATAPSRVMALQSTTSLLSAGMISILNNGKIGSDGGGGLF
ncbi:MAG: hypothetical protein OEW37_08390 [Rhodospirillaceae bacterium]|nr:hypothetical protein [Rhodospirillaceae bacterium]